MQLSFNFDCIFVLLLKKAFIVFAAVFLFLRLSSVVLACSFWFEFILFYVAVFYLRLSSSVVESSMPDPSSIIVFAAFLSFLWVSSAVTCFSYPIVFIFFVHLSSIDSCCCIFVLLLKKAFIVFAAVFLFLRVSSVVLALSFWFEFILFYVAVFYLRLSSSVIESSLLDPSSIIVFAAFLSFLWVSSAVTCFSFRIVFIFFVQMSFIFDCLLSLHLRFVIEKCI